MAMVPCRSSPLGPSWRITSLEDRYWFTWLDLLARMRWSRTSADPRLTVSAADHRGIWLVRGRPFSLSLASQTVGPQLQIPPIIDREFDRMDHFGELPSGADERMFRITSSGGVISHSSHHATRTPSAQVDRGLPMPAIYLGQTPPAMNAPRDVQLFRPSRHAYCTTGPGQDADYMWDGDSDPSLVRYGQSVSYCR